MSQIVNGVISNESINIFIAIAASMMVGATLQPVPSQLSNLLTNNFLFKWAVIVIFTTRIFHPVTDGKLFRIMVIAAIVLYLLELMRKQQL
jgi:hypothetical protein